MKIITKSPERLHGEDQNLYIAGKKSANVHEKLAHRSLSTTATNGNMDDTINFECSTLENILQDTDKLCCAYLSKLSDREEQLSLNKAIQTDYRESEAQTSPWEPPFRVRPGHENPEILSITHLKWSNGLPAGKHEVELINRMRMKNAWQAILPPMDCPKHIKMGTAIISAIQADDWDFREKEIQQIMDFRMKLLEEEKASRERKLEELKNHRFNRIKENLSNRRDKEIETIRHKFRRELRRLCKKNLKDFSRSDRQRSTRSAEFYTPRSFGRPHRSQSVKLDKEDAESESKEEILRNWSSMKFSQQQSRMTKAKQNVVGLCPREMKWNEEKLKKLHEDLRAIRLNIRPPEKLSLFRKKMKSSSSSMKESSTAMENEKTELSSNLMEKLIKEKLLQSMMLEGKEKCRELIKKLRSSKKRSFSDFPAIGVQPEGFENEMGSVEDHRLAEILSSIKKMPLSDVIKFLDKKLCCSEIEKKVHEVTLVPEGDREIEDTEIDENSDSSDIQLENRISKETEEEISQITDNSITENFEEDPKTFDIIPDEENLHRV